MPMTGRLAGGLNMGRKPNHQALTISVEIVDRDPVGEDDCVICRHWPAADRSSMRGMIARMPLREDVCEGCSMAFWGNCIVPLLPKPTKPTKH